MRKILRRIGCGGLLVLWFLFLSTPCLVAVLAIQREIAITWSDVPDDAFRVWVLQERDAQGLAISSARRINPASAPGAACVVINVRFLLWGGDAEKAGALPVHQCTCYTRPDTASAWTPSSVGPEACALAGE
ncbi:MAG: hypothetical protein IT323_18985 [Anaerolineae bacterium]|nr:hypothetical protein [Anaerolineae bacterium]